MGCSWSANAKTDRLIRLRTGNTTARTPVGHRLFTAPSTFDNSSKGITANDYPGKVVSGAGDVNGDGIADFIIGALYGDPNGLGQAGESYVIFGATNVGGAGTLELSALNGANGFVVNGAQSSTYSGTSVSAAGDINGDGIADLLIGAPRVDHDYRQQRQHRRNISGRIRRHSPDRYQR